MSCEVKGRRVTSRQGGSHPEGNFDIVAQDSQGIRFFLRRNSCTTSCGSLMLTVNGIVHLLHLGIGDHVGQVRSRTGRSSGCCFNQSARESQALPRTEESSGDHPRERTDPEPE